MCCCNVSHNLLDCSLKDTSIQPERSGFVIILVKSASFPLNSVIIHFQNPASRCVCVKILNSWLKRKVKFNRGGGKLQTHFSQPGNPKKF